MSDEEEGVPVGHSSDDFALVEEARCCTDVLVGGSEVLESNLRWTSCDLQPVDHDADGMKMVEEGHVVAAVR